MESGLNGLTVKGGEQSAGHDYAGNREPLTRRILRAG
jgi:hypothetical protein